MKKIEAFIRHEAFEPIRTELLERGFPSMSIAEYKGSGRQRGITEHYRGAELTIHLRPKLKVEIVVESDDLEDLVDVCKILGRGELSRKVTVRAHGFSKTAADAITAAGGTVETLPMPFGNGRPPAKGNALTNR